MNEDYLWNKTGSDPEIEGLENALKPLRFAGTVPPRLPAKVAIRKEESRRGFFGLWLAPAFAAVAIAIFATFAYWPTTRSGQIATGPAETTLAPTRSTATQPESPPAPAVAPRVQETVPTVTLYRVPKRQTPRPATLVAIKSDHKVPHVELTDEEKYAYSQLMLALSITSSKLKIVKDTLDGPDARSTAPIQEKDTFRK